MTTSLRNLEMSGNLQLSGKSEEFTKNQGNVRGKILSGKTVYC